MMLLEWLLCTEDLLVRHLNQAVIFEGHRWPCRSWLQWVSKSIVHFFCFTLFFSTKLLGSIAVESADIVATILVNLDKVSWRLDRNNFDWSWHFNHRLIVSKHFVDISPHKVFVVLVRFWKVELAPFINEFRRIILIFAPLLLHIGRCTALRLDLQLLCRCTCTLLHPFILKVVSLQLFVAL
jgi:hypothetical protein